ncbi:MAG: hypothetical protein FWE05_12570 [Defluviitaleaceae bacterium]|nr:hypothetical protein [Defluviitaleaceae bacterium]
MKNILRKISGMLLLLLLTAGLTACDGTYGNTDNNLPQTVASQPNDAIPPPEVALSQVQENETYHQGIIEFLSGMTTIFTGVPREENDWVDEMSVPTGRFLLGWDSETGQPVTTYEVPEIYFSNICMGGFFDRQGNQILEAPWMYVRRVDDWVSLYYASDFKLFDFNDNGIPDIFVHFNQTFDGGYAGFYRIFRYVDGEYRMLTMTSLENGVATPHPWIGRSHMLFRDSDGRIITFIDSMYHSISRYEHLVMTDEYAELHLVAEMHWETWEDWETHHWMDWSDRIPSGWFQNNPTIFGTDISLTIVEPLHELQEHITAIISM